MKISPIVLFSASCFFSSLLMAAEQTAEVVSFQTTLINFGFTGSVADVNNGLIPYDVGLPPGTTAWGVSTTTGGPSNLNIHRYATFNDGATQTAPISQAIIEIAVQPTLGTASLNPGGAQLVFTPNGAFGDDSVVIKFTDGTNEVAPRRTLAIKVLNTAPTVTLSASPVFGVPPLETSFVVTTADANGHAVSVSYDYGDGSTGTASSHTYSKPGVYTLTVSANDSFDTVTKTATITVVPPTLSVEVSPSRIVPGESVAIFPSILETGGYSHSFSFDFGDGSTGTATSHTYSTPGIYTITVNAFDGVATTVTQTTTVEVTNDAARVPVPRFTTSDVVGFVGQPLGFDAFYSTDPQNVIASYSWNFGDGSPAGSGQLISKVYATPGTYTVTLTIRDGEGIQASTQRLIEILPADQIGLFNAFVEFKTSFDRTKSDRDSITLKARLNVGDSQIGDGSAVALEVAGQRFASTLDRKLRASVKIAPKQTWKVQFATRKQSAGQVDVQVTIKNADLGSGFNQLGAVAGGDGSASITVPVRLEVGAYSFEIPCDTEFEFNRAGTKAKGEGASE